MATREQVENALIKADEQGDTENATLLAQHLVDLRDLDDAKEIAKTFNNEMLERSGVVGLALSQFTNEEELKDFGLEVASGVNSGFTGLLDIPPQIFNAVSSLAGLPQRATMISDLPFIQEATTGGFMEEGVTQKAVRVGGQFFGGSILPTAGVIQASKNIPELAKTALKIPQGSTQTGKQAQLARVGLRESAARDPMKFLKKEAFTASLFATGGGIFSELSSNDPLAELVGGFLFASRVGSTNIATQAVKETSATAKQMFSQKARRERSVELIKKFADDPDQALSTLNKNLKVKGLNGTLSQMTNDRGIASLEKYIININKENLSQKITSSDKKVNEFLFNKIDEIAQAKDGGAFRDFVQQRVRGSTNKINNIVDKAIDNAKHTAKTANTPLAQADASRIFSNELDLAFKQIRKVEDEAWSVIPKSFVVETAPLKKAVTESFKTLTPTARRDVVSDIAKPRGLINKLSDEVSPKELADLRSSITAQKRAVQDSASATTVNQLNNMQKIIGDVIDSVDNSASYRAATAITKRKHELFNEGVFAKSTRKSLEEDIGEKLIRSGGSGGHLADDVLSMAKDYNINLKKASEDMIRTSFFHQVEKNGVINQNSVDRFLLKHENLLNRFPNVLKDLTDVKKTQELALQHSKLGSKAIANMERNKSKLYSEFDDPIRAIDSALRTKDQTKAFKYLVNAAKKDPDGDALKGLKRDAIDHLLNKISVEEGFKPTFKKELSKAKKGYSEIFSPEEFKEMQKIFSLIDSVLIRYRASTTKFDSTDPMLPQVLGQIGGARLGAQFGTTPLIAAGLGRKISERYLSKLPTTKALGLVEDMILNPSNFAKYYDDVSKAKTAEEVSRALNAWIISAGVSTAYENP